MVQALSPDGADQSHFLGAELAKVVAGSGLVETCPHQYEVGLATSVFVTVMDVRSMRMPVDLRVVSMWMCMWPRQRGIVVVVVMAVVVGVGVVVAQLLVGVLVPVLLGDVQDQAGDEQHRGDCRRDAAGSVA